MHYTITVANVAVIKGALGVSFFIMSGNVDKNTKISGIKGIRLKTSGTETE